MPRIIATVNEETERAMLELQSETDAPIAAQVRKAIEEYLAKRGKPVSTSVRWGGKREPAPRNRRAG